MLHHGSCGTTLHLKSCSPRTSWRYFYTCFYYWENVSTLQPLLVSFWKSEKMWLKGLKIKPFRKVQRLYNLSAFLVIRWLYPPTEFSIAPIKNAGPATGNPVGGVGTAKVWTKDCCKLVSVSAMLVSIHQKNIAQAFILERYFFVSIYPAVIPGTYLMVSLVVALLLCLLHRIYIPRS